MTDRDKLIERLLAKRGLQRGQADAVKDDALSRRDPAAPPVLSFGQERIHFLCQLDPSGAIYNMPVALRLVGELDPSALERALMLLVRRHEVLRTRYETRAEGLAAVVDSEVAITLAVHDLTGVAPEHARHAEAEQLMEREASRPFDLERAPLVRGSLLQMAPDEHWLLMVVHHIAGDQWSLGVLQRELVHLYADLVRGREPTLEPPTIQFSDFADWQRRRSSTFDEQIAYWREQLAGGTPTIDLPTNTVGRGMTTAEGARIAIDFPAGTTRKVSAYARARGATPFMVWTALWLATLRESTGQADLRVGTPIAGRTRSELSGMVGFVANTVVLRVPVDAAASFDALVDDVKRIALEAYAHQEVPFDKVVEALQPARQLGQNPLFQVMLVYQDAARIVDLEGLRAMPLEVAPSTTRMDLTLVLRPGDDDAVHAYLEYAAARFDEVTVTRLRDRLMRNANAMLESASAPLSHSGRMSDAERSELLALALGAAGGEVATVVDRLDFSTPDAVALTDGHAQITYAELDRQTRAVASLLQSRGVARGQRVAILMDRSIQAIVAYVGVMRARAACVPIDAVNPRERVELILEQSEAVIVLTDERHAPRVPVAMTGPIVPFVVLDTQDLADGRDEEPCAPSPDDLAYVVFTSGSTGVPKGVMIPHGALATTVAGLVAAFEVQPDERILQFVSLGFDVAASEIFMALTTGATLVVAKREQLVPGPALVALLRERKISMVSMPASVLSALPHEPLPALRALIVGGELCPDDVVRRWRDDRTLYNCYGPTEATITATWTPAGDASFPGIGQPMPGVQCYVLDETLQLAAHGSTGQLALGGRGVGWGYTGLPTITAEHFVPDPFGQGRLYLTGDRVRWRADGNLEFRGRHDAQVKVRGHRVELKECERVLRAHPQVSETWVVVHQREGADELVAYVVGSELDLAELRRFAASKLPSYMVPAIFMPLDRLPRTSTNKLDSAALPVPKAAVDAVIVGPRDEIETALCRIWEEVLDTRPVGIHADFFDSGGNSFLIMRLLTRVEAELGCRLAHTTLFESGTVAAMADLVRERLERTGHRAIVRIRKGADSTPVYCVHPVGGNVLCYGTFSRLLTKGRPVFGIQARGADDHSPPRDDLVTMAEAYVAEILAAEKRPVALVGWSLGGTVAYEMACRLQERGTPVALLALVDATAPWAMRRSIDEPALMSQLLRDLSGFAGITPPSHEELAAASATELEAMAVAHVTRAKLFKRGEERAEVLRHVALYRAHMNAHLHYHPRSYDGDVLYIAAVGSSYRREARERWKTLVRGRLDELEVHARHADVLQRPHVSTVASALDARLAALDDVGHFTGQGHSK